MGWFNNDNEAKIEREFIEKNESLFCGKPIKEWIVKRYLTKIAITNDNHILYAAHENSTNHTAAIDVSPATLLNCEITENGTTIQGGYLGRAIVGDLIAGPAGAIIGASTRKSKDMITDISVHILTSDPKRPSITIKLNETSVENGGYEHRQLQQKAQEIRAAILAIIEQNKKREAERTMTASEKSPADKLRELKQLLDDGLITEEEYSELRKKALEKLV